MSSKDVPSTSKLIDDNEDKGYIWEGEYEKTWEAINEDDEGHIGASVLELIHRAKRQRLASRHQNVKLGIMRHVLLIVDLSEAMLTKDLLPTRHAVTCDMLQVFIADFYDHNPISQLGIVTSKDKRAQILLELSGNSHQHLEALQKLRDVQCTGDCSVQNALEIALQRLKQVPSHSSREVIFILGALSTCDPGDLRDTLQKCAEHKIRINVISLSAQVHILKQAAYLTGGTSHVVIDAAHLREILFALTLPPPAKSDTGFSQVRMGFPMHKRTRNGEPLSMCACHMPAPIDLPHKSWTFTDSGYFCPECCAKYCNLPQQCRLCKLTLVSAPQLARSYQHLAPLPAFAEVSLENSTTSVLCKACDGAIEHRAYVCNKCNNRYCIECDLLLHESLHVCPGCCTSSVI